MKAIKRYTWDEIMDEVELGKLAHPEPGPAMLRLSMAKIALRSYVQVDDEPEAITDLLSDLRHLCDALGLDFAELDRIAYRHYIEEKGDTNE